MENEITARLSPVRKRREKQTLLDAVGRGFLRGATVAVVLGLLRWPLDLLPLPALWGWPLAGIVAAAVALAAIAWGIVAGVRQAARKKSGWQAAARAVDDRYRLEDRTVTALQLAEKAERKPLEELALADARAKLAHLDLAAVVPVAIPRSLVAAAILTAVSVALFAWPQPEALSRLVRQEASPASPAAAPAPREPAADAGVSRHLRESIDWQDAPAGRIAPRPNRGTGEQGLAKVLAEAARTSEISDEERSPNATVLEPASPSLEHRRTVRRYFESIRPKEDDLL